MSTGWICVALNEGVDPRHNTGEGGGGECEQEPRDGNTDRIAQNFRNGKAHQEAGRHADDPAADGDERGLHQELEDDVPLARADGPPDADLHPPRVDRLGAHRLDVDDAHIILKNRNIHWKDAGTRRLLPAAIAPCLNRPVVIKRSLSIGHR